METAVRKPPKTTCCCCCGDKDPNEESAEIPINEGSWAGNDETIVEVATEISAVAGTVSV